MQNLQIIKMAILTKHIKYKVKYQLVIVIHKIITLLKEKIKNIWAYWNLNKSFIINNKWKEILNLPIIIHN